ncbi:MAG: hypothetical protein KF725_12265 [Cyclobacteriaceae bacterium]|nr:hypothetical protein [Cyclobacteriaceae bacterium]UYN86472.1 MAG: hypothetical protein KIT51_16660 [Cyclobacteriaceae bacterium]
MKFRFPTIKTELAVAFAAIFVSTATLFVYVYQARIMQTQQQVAVWPYVEWLPSWGDHGLYVEVSNKGIGPALVKKVTLKLDGKEFNSLSEMFEVLTDSTFQNYGYSTIQGRVIAPGEHMRAFEIWDKATADRIRAALTKRNFEYEICYCSVFNDCWLSNGTQITESNCD